MASLRKKLNCENWFACFMTVDGRRVQRSTGTASRAQAMKIALEYEAAHRGRKTARQVQKVMGDLYRDLSGADAPVATVEDFAKRWLDQRKPEVSSSTHAFYALKVNQFVDFLGDRRAADLNEISKAHIVAFRDELLRKVSHSSVNHSIKILRMLFRAARSDGLIFENPVEFVKTVRNANRIRRRAFTLSELQRTLAFCNPEWRTLVLLGVYTGQRLGDLATLTWKQVDLGRAEIRFTTKKTGRHQEIPIAPPLLAHLTTIPAGDDPAAPLCPGAYAAFTKEGRSASLSGEFAAILMKADLIPKKTHKKVKGGKGRGGVHIQSALSFHCLRHTSTSLMKNAGVSSSVVEDFIGHDSEEMNKIYSHIDMAAKRAAAEALPDITKPIT